MNVELNKGSMTTKNWFYFYKMKTCFILEKRQDLTF